MEDGKEELERLKLVKEIPGNLSPDFKNRLEANAFNVLTCLLNLVGANVSYYATFEGGGRALSKTGSPNGVFRINPVVRVFKTLVTDIQNVYGDAKNDFVRSLVTFDKSLLDAGLLLLKRVDNTVGVLLSGREGLSYLQG